MHRVNAVLIIVMSVSACCVSDLRGAVIWEGSTPISNIEDALKGRVIESHEGGTMRINLYVGGLLYHSPTIIQVSISDLAHQFGFDHFNWISQIVAAPDHWKWYTGPTLTHQIDPPSQFNPFNDPATAPLTDWTIVSAAKPLGSPVVPDSKVVDDSHPAYWNEAGYGGTPDAEWRSLSKILCDGGFALCGSVGGRHFLFEDTPTVAQGMYGPGESILFKTSLAGIRADGTYQTWDGIGTTFYWNSNAVSASNVLRLKAFNDVPQIITGGVFGIVADTVPEPNALLIAVLGGVLATRMIVCRQRRAESWLLRRA